MKKFLVVAAAILGVGVWGNSASATVLWSVPGTGCLPVDETIQSDLVDGQAHYVRTKGSKTGSTRMRCPVTDDDIGTFDGLELTYEDTDGTTGNHRVYGRLRRVSRTTGSSWSTIGEVDSGAAGQSARSSIHTQLKNVSSQSLNLDSYFYYVELLIVRNNTSDTPKIYGFSIVDAPN